jgi:two-component system, OmpR family, sensor histidine kinase ArlS
MLQVLLFSLLANAIFFQSRYNKQQGQLPPGAKPPAIQKMVLGKNRMQEVEIFTIDSPEGKMIRKSQRWKSIAKIDDTYFMYRRNGDDLIVTNVTPHMDVQKNLVWISLYLMLFFWALSYILSRFFVKTSLKKLNDLLWFLNTLHIDNLNEKIEITGHPDDEINRVSTKFNEALEKIHKQTLSLKDFVTNASHELKTPLMSMSTEIDYTSKTRNYEQGLDNLKHQLKWINQLLETLVTISRLEALETLSKEQTDISELTQTVVHDVEKIYQQKHILLTIHIQNDISKKIHKNSLNIIIKNILENAYKFTPEWGVIDISLDAKKLIIKDTGKGIAENDLEHIRERFRQADRSKTDTKSFGLWLYLTKLLVEKHWWKIHISSKVNKGTTCTINF